MQGKQTVAAVLARDLASYGARRCFGLLGTANFKISHALAQAGVELISARHECNAASMADAYAKSTQELTLVSVHSGPGLTNALTGIAEAAKSRTPLLVLAGDVPAGAVTSNFYFDQAQMARSVGAVAERIHTPATAREDARRAATRALRDRRTVVLSLPTDVQDAEAPGDIAALKLPPAPGAVQPAAGSLERLVQELLRAKRPVLIAGRGAVIAGAERAIAALADRTRALLATSICGHGLFAGHPWNAGISGGFASPAASELIAESDLIIGFGVSLTHWTTKRGKLIAPGAKVAQIDIEASKLGYHTPIDVAVHADARAAAEAALAELGARPITGSEWRNERTAKRLQEGSNLQAPYQDTSTDAFVDPRTLSKAVDALLPDQRTVASDSGHFCGWVPRYLRVPDARSSCLSHSFQSVGLGLASAIGLAIANPGALAVLGAGDGGFLMSLADLETAVRLKLRMCILIYNDSSYAAEVHLFKRRGYSIDIVQFPDTDFAAIARGYGAQAATVRALRDLEPVRQWVREGAPGVFVIDGKINPHLEADWHAEHFPA
jgi:thiamine pyrophosphate-dependent acetolactate synthase large subunit-like protein